MTGLNALPGWRRAKPVGAPAGPVDWVTGAALALRRQALEEVGPFDEEFRFYGQDLELCLRLAQESQPPFFRPAVRPLVWKHRAGLVGLEPEGRDETGARACDSVRADVVLGQRPERRRFLAEHALVAPLAVGAASLLLGVGQRQVDDVVRVLLEVARSFFRADDVVRWGDQLRQRTGQVRVVAKRAKSLNVGHGR